MGISWVWNGEKGSHLRERSNCLKQLLSRRRGGKKTWPILRWSMIRLWAGSKNWAECPSRPRSGSPGEGEQRTGPSPCSAGLPYAPDSIGCPNVTKQWPRKQSTRWLYLYHRTDHASPYPAHKSLSREHPAPVLLPAHPLPSLAFLSHIFQGVQRLHCHHRKSHTWLRKKRPLAALALQHWQWGFSVCSSC